MQPMALASGIHRLFKILYQVAQSQIEANFNLETLGPEILNDEFNDYLSILDFAMQSQPVIDHEIGEDGGDGAGGVGGAFARGRDYDFDFDSFSGFVAGASDDTHVSF